MEEFNFDTIAQWLSTTEQQFQVIKTIYRLESKHQETTPKEISKEYEKQYNKIIQKPNLFTLLRTLAVKDLIQKDASSNYKVNFNGIQQALNKHREKLDKEKQEFQKAQSKTEEYFRKNISKHDRPTVNYYEQKELYGKMGKSLQNASKLHIVSNFPIIAYTTELIHGLGREEYGESLWRGCFKEKKLHVNYLTNLNLDALFNHSFRVFGDPKVAYRECRNTINRLETQISTSKKLDVRFTEDPHGLHVAVVEWEEPAEVYLFIRDEHGDSTGGIHIKNKQTAINALQQFNQNYEYAEKLNSPAGLKKVQKLKEKVKQKYGILE